MSSISPAFIDISVQPSYGRGTVLVSWVVADAFRDGLFFVYKSCSGEAPWQLLNPTEDGVGLPLRGVFSIEDRHTQHDLALVPHYRLFMVHTGEEHDSAVVGAYDRLFRSQYAGVHRIMTQELQRMKHNGIRMWHCIPLTSGEPNPRFDADTKQELSVDCPDAGDPSYGLPFKGGYGPPSLTFVEKGQTVRQKQDDAEGAGTEELVQCPARLPAFPQPARGHLLIHPATDERWVVSASAIQPFLFKGVAAIAYQVTLQLLRRSDPRYRIPLPPLP